MLHQAMSMPYMLKKYRQETSVRLYVTFHEDFWNIDTAKYDKHARLPLRFYYIACRNTFCSKMLQQHT